jgi:two-component system sensor histidine kinase CpxA
LRSLFGRLFVAFWGAIALVAALLVASSPYFTRSRPGIQRWERGAELLLERRAEEAARRVERGFEPGGAHDRGRDGFFERRHGGLWVLDADGDVMAGPPPETEVLDFARRVAADGAPATERIGSFHLAGRPVRRPDGAGVVVVAGVRRSPQLVDLIEPRALAGRLLLLAAVVALPSWWIARHLSKPVAAVQGAARRLAAGELAARVGAASGRHDELGDLARDFDAMATRLEALVEGQRRLVRDVSHELRSPLARLRVALELARDRAGAEAAPALDRIEHESERLDALVQQILTLSRLDAASAPARRERVDVAELAESVAADASFEAEARRVEVAVAAGGAAVVEGDPDALRSALDNVVRNAVRHTGEASTVRIAVEAGATAVTVAVDDQGPGVPGAALGSLFEPFFRVEEARERDRGGAGLGLAIAARAVRLHGGDIVARNRREGGLVVTISLPAVPPTQLG